ncbi:hypothetical protein [Methylobacterium sp. WCS2018Hpa-22]|uniref:hypothetical protein n=1 Tax=Methylobacterium sp. WCS2018Hpa-22 TaxID=3073633 RepID=UPI002889DA0F|nr:hypothetical protein [Methylobacterium sp. WCS2018Hpa-22]
MAKSPCIRAIPQIFNYKPRNEHDVRKHLTGFEGKEEAEKRHKSLLKFLKKYQPLDSDLITRLSRCRRNHRCRLQSCPMCMRRLRIWFCDQVAPLISAVPREWLWVTLIPERHCHPEGSLAEFKPQNLIEDLRRALRSHGIKDIVICGAIDYCMEIRKTVEFTPLYHWVPHCHLLVRISSKQQSLLRTAFSTNLPSSTLVDRPVHIAPLKSDGFEILRPISYCVKARFNSVYVPPRSESKPKAKRKKQRMHGRHQAELASFLARNKLKDRLVLIGAKRVQKSIVLSARLHVRKTNARATNFISYTDAFRFDTSW